MVIPLVADQEEAEHQGRGEMVEDRRQAGEMVEYLRLAVGTVEYLRLAGPSEVNKVEAENREAESLQPPKQSHQQLLCS